MSTASHTHARHSNGKLSSVRDEIEELKDTVITGVHDTTEGGKRVVQAAGAAAMSSASGLGKTAMKSAMRTRENIGSTIADRPFTSVALAAGIGAVLGAGFMLWRRR